jgi:hypothetical protein
MSPLPTDTDPLSQDSAEGKIHVLLDANDEEDPEEPELIFNFVINMKHHLCVPLLVGNLDILLVANFMTNKPLSQPQ